jgi:hypothetical protein
VDDLEQRVERKIDKKLLERSDTGELDREAVKQEIISELKEEQAGQRQGWLESMDTDSVSRRSFLKMLGLGTGGLALASSASADFGQVLASTQGTSDINADSVDGKDASDLGTDLTNLTSSYNVQSVSDSVGIYQDGSNTKTDSTELVSVSGSGWVLSGKYSRNVTKKGFRASASAKVNMDIDGNSFTNFSSGIIPAFYFDSSFSIDLSASGSSGGPNYTFARANASASVKYIK